MDFLLPMSCDRELFIGYLLCCPGVGVLLWYAYHLAGKLMRNPSASRNIDDNC